MVMPRQVLGVQPVLLEALLDVKQAGEEVSERFVRACKPPGLDMVDFEMWGQSIGLAVRILAGAVRQKAEGVNVLVGDVDAGMMHELPGLMAREAGCTLYEGVHGPVRVLSMVGRSPLRLAQQVLAGRRDVIHLVCLDVTGVEDDNDLPPFGRWRRSASFRQQGLMRELAGNPVPAIWVCEDVQRMGPALLESFTYVVQVGRLAPGARCRVYTGALGDLEVSEGLLARIASSDALGPEELGRAARTTRLAAPRGVEETDRVLEGLLQGQLACRGASLPEVQPRTGVGRYSLDYLNATMDVHRLVERLSERPRGRVLFSGPPGTGKTMLAGHIATMAGKGLLTRKASDLLGCYVGESEKHIRDMFQEARREDRIVLLDEADSFLRERATALRSWEVTQVNELLVQMERFDGLFICSTNLTRDMDRACFRRFDVKVRFAHLTPDQARSMLQAMVQDMGLEPPGQELLRAVGAMTLTPGDFRTVRRQQQILDGDVDAAAIVEMLRQEAMKDPHAHARAGF